VSACTAGPGRAFSADGRARPNPALAGRCDDALRTGGALADLMAALELTTPRRRNKAVPPSGLPRDTMNFEGRALRTPTTARLTFAREAFGESLIGYDEARLGAASPG
jgi:hypothetical protein